jgi:O-antigen biosynthesis protein
MPNLPVVLIFGAENINLKSAGPIPHFETQDLECHCFLKDNDLQLLLYRYHPVAIVSFGDPNSFKNLNNLPFDMRRRWLHFPAGFNLDKVGQAVYSSFITDVCVPREAPPLVTVFTPTYKTGHRIQRPLQSLLSQTYKEWEWILFDDSDDDDKTFKELVEISKQDSRIHVFKSHRHSGIIGEVKKWAASLGRGKYLVELDHDDELTSDGLSNIIEAFQKNPDGLFAYTDCAEVYEVGGNNTYSKGWGFGYGTEKSEVYQGRHLISIRAPLPNPKTIRHIVSSPNHIRAWEKDFYHSIGGHSRLMHVADDYELCVRTFLNTKMIQIRRLGYIQYYNHGGSNTQFVRNKDIQRLVRSIRESYDKRIHQRFLDFGINDFVWDNKSGYSNLNIPNPEIEEYLGIIFE